MTEVDCNNCDFDISHSCSDRSERRFAEIIGCIEGIVISEDFLVIQTNFLEKYYKEFEDDEENRLIYMDIFKKYLSTVEKYIEEQLTNRIPGFNLKQFEADLEKMSDQLDMEIYEILSTFWDFGTFKKMFLDYKQMKEGHGIDLSEGILITKCNY